MSIEFTSSLKLEVWTDAGVAHAEQPDCVSAAAVRSSPLPRDTFVASAGRLACSFSAEVCAFVGSLERFAPTIPPKSAVLLAVDSQSLLSALEAGPLRTTEDFTGRIWALLLALADRECLCVLQFVYSHVGFPPPPNAAIDALVTAHLDEDAPPLWITMAPRFGMWMWCAPSAASSFCAGYPQWTMPALDFAARPEPRFGS